MWCALQGASLVKTCGLKERLGELDHVMFPFMTNENYSKTFLKCKGLKSKFGSNCSTW